MDAYLHYLPCISISLEHKPTFALHRLFPNFIIDSLPRPPGPTRNYSAVPPESCFDCVDTFPPPPSASPGCWFALPKIE